MSRAPAPVIKAVIAKQEWEKKLAGVNVRKDDMVRFSAWGVFQGCKPRI